MKTKRFHVVQTFELNPPYYKKCDSCKRWASYRHDCYEHTSRAEITRYACREHQAKKFYLVEEDVFRYLVRKVE